MKPDQQKKMDEIIYETNEKITAIVDEIRNIRFSQMNEKEKQEKCNFLREEFEKVMVEEEKKVEEVMKEA